MKNNWLNRLIVGLYLGRRWVLNLMIALIILLIPLSFLLSPEQIALISDWKSILIIIAFFAILNYTTALPFYYSAQILSVLINESAKQGIAGAWKLAEILKDRKNTPKNLILYKWQLEKESKSLTLDNFHEVVVRGRSS